MRFRLAYDNDANMVLSDESLREIKVCVPADVTAHQAIGYAIEHSDVCFTYDRKVILGVYGKGNFFMFFGKVDDLPLSFYKELIEIKALLLWRYGVIHSIIMCDDEDLKKKFEVRLGKYLGATFGKPYEAAGHRWIRWEMKLKP